MYALEIEETCKKNMAKAGLKNSEFKKAVENKFRQILEDPHRFKSLHYPLQNKKRVHILKSFVMVFEIDEKKKVVRILDLDHHDNIYR